MDWSVIVILILLAVNTIVVMAILLSALALPKGGRSTRVVYALIFLACPVVGVTAFSCMQLLNFLFRDQRLDTSNLSFNKDREQALLPPDADTEMNYVPILDALVTQDNSSLRRLLLDLLKNKTVFSASSVSKAVTSKDAETSHYAASAITDFLSEFRSKAQSMLLRIRQSPFDVTLNISALEYLNQTLNMHVMDEIEQRSYIYTTDGVAENLYTNNKWFMTSEHYLWMTDQLISIKDYHAAAKWVERAQLCRPMELSTFKCAIHLYYASQDHEKLYQTIDALKRSNIWIDKELLDLLRMLGDRKED